MKNIIRSIAYELLRSRLMVYVFILITISNALIAILNIEDNSFHEATGSAMIAEANSLTFLFAEFFVIFAVGVICGSDLTDKVANYEILSGHSRRRVYLARSIFGVLLASVLGLVLSLIPMAAGTAIFGWGHRLVFRDVLIRHLLYVFPFLRIAAFTVILTFLIKNQYAVMGIGYGIVTFNTIASGMVAERANLLTANFNLNLLSAFEGWRVYNLSAADGIVYYATYDSGLSAEAIAGTILLSIALAAVYLLIGYALFQRDDLN